MELILTTHTSDQPIVQVAAMQGIEMPGITMPSVSEASEQLAQLLLGADALRTYNRLARLVRFDPEASRLFGLLRGGGLEWSAREVLIAELEALPLIKEYRAAEVALHALFAAVDQAISDAAGLPFAVNARPDACPT